MGRAESKEAVAGRQAVSSGLGIPVVAVRRENTNTAKSELAPSNAAETLVIRLQHFLVDPS